jgi:teichoic acid transport system ATP-binding protein
VRRTRLVHALKGISFVAYEGEAIGVIGSNGSGKSTLLRAIAGLTPATQGTVYADGEPTMLGVGAALINDLSGERNVVLGSLALGMMPEDVQANFDRVVEFSGIGDQIELPMRTYSSGMQARLRFAIAASARHNILLIDEALSVGDAEFNKRSQKRIQEMRREAGTVFLVSHSLKSITETCDRALWIEKGELRMDGAADDVVKAYTASVG